MKKIFLFVFSFSTAISAETFTTKIHSFDHHLVKFENGRVAFLDSNKMTFEKGDEVEVELDHRLGLISLKKTREKSARHLKNLFQDEVTSPALFEPTIVSGIEKAQLIFNRSNSFFKISSECSDRAHIWAHEEFKMSGTKSMKAFIFFTASYIKSVRFKWWFHVAPMYKIDDNGKIKDLVMDYAFSDRPLTVKEWSDLFVYTKRPCKVTTKFSDYDVNPQTENCYIIFESMHYRLPGQIYEKELSGTHKTSTSEAEISRSRSWAFENERAI